MGVSWPRLRRAVYRRDQGRCQVCLSRVGRLWDAGHGNRVLMCGALQFSRAEYVAPRAWVGCRVSGRRRLLLHDRAAGGSLPVSEVELRLDRRGRHPAPPSADWRGQGHDTEAAKHGSSLETAVGVARHPAGGRRGADGGPTSNHGPATRRGNRPGASRLGRASHRTARTGEGGSSRGSSWHVGVAGAPRLRAPSLGRGFVPPMPR
jgi:hypothetical protein